MYFCVSFILLIIYVLILKNMSALKVLAIEQAKKRNYQMFLDDYRYEADTAVQLEFN